MSARVVPATCGGRYRPDERPFRQLDRDVQPARPFLRGGNVRRLGRHTNAPSADGLVVEQSTDAWDTYSTLGDGVAPTASSLSPGTLDPSQTYYFRVRAYRNGGYDQNSPVDRVYSDYRNGTVLLAAPAAPTRVTAVTLDDTSVQLSFPDIGSFGG